MIPGAFVFLDALPLSPNGKVDLRALDAIETNANATQGGGTPPGTDLERSLAEIVAEGLGLERPSVTANFFDLGANSLRIAQIHRKIRELMGADIAIVDLFKRPTIRSLACLLSERSDSTPDLACIGDEARRRKAARRERLAKRVPSTD